MAKKNVFDSAAKAHGGKFEKGVKAVEAALDSTSNPTDGAVAVKKQVAQNLQDMVSEFTAAAARNASFDELQAIGEFIKEAIDHTISNRPDIEAAIAAHGKK
jgi:hypothetical protein